MLFRKNNPNAGPEVQAIYDANIERNARLDSAANYGTGQGSASAKVADMMARERTAANDYRRDLTRETRGSEVSMASQPRLDSAAQENMRRRIETGADIRNAGGLIENRYNEQEIPIRQAAAGGALELNKARVGNLVGRTGIEERESAEGIRTSQTNRDIATDQNMSSLARQGIERDLLKRGGNVSIDQQEENLRRYREMTPYELEYRKAEITGRGEQNREMTIRNDGQAAANAAIPDETNARIRAAQRAAAKAEGEAQAYRDRPSTLPLEERRGDLELQSGNQQLTIEQRESDTKNAEAEEKLRLSRELRPEKIRAAGITNDMARAEADFKEYMAKSAQAKEKAAAERNAFIYGDGPRPEEYRQMLEQQNAGAEYAGIDEEFESSLNDAFKIIGASTSGTTTGGLTGTGTFGNTENLLGAIRDASMLVDRLEGPNVDVNVAARRAEKALRGLPIANDSGEYVGVPPVAGSILTLGANAAWRAGDREKAAKQLTELSNRLKKIASRQAPRRREIPPARGE